MISKYPPIQGGISAKTYWMVKGFAEKGVTVHVVTNANCVEEEYCIDDQSPDLPANLTVHYIDPDIPWHIPSSDLYVPRLLDKALEIVGNNHIDIIDTNYLIPYGIVGYLLSRITGIPYILRHGGSDIAKFLEQGVFSHLLHEVIKNASAIVTDNKNRKFFEDINSDIYTLPRYIPNERYFKPIIVSHEIPTFAYIGKINYYWQYKSLHRIVEIFSGLKENYRLIFVGQGKGFEEFSKFVSGHRLKGYEFRQFVHPANMPHLLSEIDFLINFDKDNPIRDFSNIFCEALWSGVQILTDETKDLDIYTQYIELAPDNQVINLPVDDIEMARTKITNLMTGWQGPKRYANNPSYSFDNYLDANIKVYNGI